MLARSLLRRLSVLVAGRWRRVLNFRLFLLFLAENYITKPLVIEKEGVDDDGNEFYEKDIIMGSGFQGGFAAARPILAQPRLVDALMGEERNLLNANLPMLAQPRLMGEERNLLRLVDAQLPRMMGMLNAGRGRLFTSTNDFLSSVLPEIQLGRQHMARLPFGADDDHLEIGWNKPSLRVMPSFGVVMSSKIADREPFG